MYERNSEMSKKELGIIPRLRWGITGIASASLFIVGVVYAFFAVLAWAEYADSLPKNKN